MRTYICWEWPRRTCRLEYGSCHSTSCHTAHRVVFSSHGINRRVNSIVQKGYKRLFQWAWSKSTNANLPITPAELPMKVPLRVTEFKTLLIRNLVFDTARGLRAPSRTPHAPPRAKPEKKKVNMWQNRTIRGLKMVVWDAKIRWELLRE